MVLAQVGRLTRPGAFRLLLATIVFVYHLSSFGVGSSAVYVFFTLSGIWVYRMWHGRYAKTRLPYLTYIVSRAWRLAPTMLLVSALAIAVSPLVGVPWAQVFASGVARLATSTVLFLGYSQLAYMPIGPAWSLDVEVQFYLLAPVLALLFARRGAVAIAMLIPLAVCSLIASQTMVSGVLPRYVAFFAFGMAAAAFDWRPSTRIAAGSVAAVILLVAAIFVSPWRGVLIGGAHPPPLYVWNPAFNVVLAMLALPFAVYTTWQPGHATDRMMADLSYIIYLLHWPAVQAFGLVSGSFWHRVPAALAALAVVAAGSWIIWRFYDRPLNMARSRWVAGRLVPPPPAPAPVPA